MGIYIPTINDGRVAGVAAIPEQGRGQASDRDPAKRDNERNTLGQQYPCPLLRGDSGVCYDGR
jgi:hypothetical protein